MRRAISASVFCTDWREISGRPNVSRSRHHCTVMSRQRWALEYACAARAMRSETNACAIWAKPLFSAPTRLAAGTRRVDVGQLGGVRGPPTHLVQLAGDLEARCALLDRPATKPRRARAAGAHRGDDVVGAHPGGDVGLGAVDDVVITGPCRGGPQVPDVGAAAGFGDGQRADQLAGQRRADERVDQPRIAGRDHVRHRDAAGEQRREHAAGHAGLMQLLADRSPRRRRRRHRRRPPRGSSRPAGRPRRRARCSSRGSSPMRSHSSTWGKISRSANERTVLRSWSRSGVVQMLTAALSPGMSTWRLRSHSPSPLACGSNRAW